MPLDPRPPVPAAPVKLDYAAGRRRRPGAGERITAAVTAVAAVVVIGSGSVAWALMMHHR